ncbi:hypothetical protein SDC9_201497 [bioreactor metagenome]|uniref:Uncharacterized protein n=1 Tax=bioreactor metagenome TaxID=1076179 RepID=A0A645ISC0_9ZZZZ
MLLLAVLSAGKDAADVGFAHRSRAERRRVGQHGL